MRQITKKDQQRQLLSWLKEQGKNQKPTILILTLLYLLLFVGHLVLFWQLTVWAQLIIVDTALPKDDITSIVYLVVTMCIILIIEKIKIYVSRRCEVKLFTQLQNSFFELLSTGQYALTRSHSTYFWQQIWLNHLPTIAAFNTHYLVQQRFVMAVPFIVLMCVFPINWLIGLSLLVSLPIVPLFMIIIGKGASALHQRHFKALERLGSVFVDRIKSLSLLRIFDAHDKQVETLSNASDALNQRTMQVVGIAFLSATTLDFFSTLAVALVAVFVGFNLLGEFTWGGQLNLNTGLFLLLVAPLCFAELKQLGRLYHLRAEALAVAETLMPIFDSAHVSCDEYSKEVVNAKAFDSLQWNDFYTQTPPLSAKKIDLYKGNWVWLTGQSGSGKTCFLESLMGQRKASHCLENAVLISQNAVILPSSIRENLALGGLFSDDELLTAIAHVELGDWLSQQVNGIDTVLDENIPMSGGQKQRLALARVLLTDAEIILLDEPTAHLTIEQHYRLSDMIRNTLSGRTVIWASHKPLPMEWFDRKWKMTKGELTQ